MPQNVSTSQSRESLTAPTPVQPWSAEVYADQLMDDLFADLDRILEGGSKLPTETVQPEYVALRSVVMPPLSGPPVVVEALDLEQASGGELVEAVPGESLATTSAPALGWRWSLDKLLLVAGLVSLVVTLILLLTNQNRPTWLGSLTAPASQNAPLSASDSQFVNYMMRSLNIIDRKQDAKQAKATGTPSTTPLNPLAANPAPTVLERVYIPIYPAQTPAALTAPATLPVPAARPSLVLPPQAAAPIPVIPSVPAAPQAPAVQHTLVGLLELGDRSAALFEVNGITQRFKVGESIGASGWTLVSVANQEAVIRRNGEVRSVYVGQKL